MNIKSLVILGVSLLAAPFVSAALMPEIKLAAGTLVFDPTGAMTLRATQGDILFSTGYFAPGWSLRSQWQLSDGVTFNEVGPNEWTWAGAYTQKTVGMTTHQKVTSTDGQVNITYEMYKPAGFSIEPGAKDPFITVVINTPENVNKEINLSGKTVLLPDNNVWSFGNRVVFTAWDFELKSDDGISMSVWDVNKGSGSSIRLPLKKTASNPDGSASYKLTIHLK